MEMLNVALLQSLENIRKECKKHKKCEDCPLRSSLNDVVTDCELLRKTPNKWEFAADEPKTVPRVFK